MSNLTDPSTDTKRSFRRRQIAGFILLAVGITSLVGRYIPFDFGQAVPLLIGVTFIGWALGARNPGLLIPGGILVGLGTGLLLRESYGNGVFLLCFASGWMLIVLLSSFAFKRTQWWPLYPAGAIAFAGLAQLSGSNVHEWMREYWYGWPLGLIAVAFFLLFSKPREKV